MQAKNDDPLVTISDMDGAFGRRLSQLMDERDVSGGAIARLLGVTRTTVSAWRGGRVANMKAIYIRKLAEFFRVNPRWLETGFGSRELPAPDERNVVEVPRRRYDAPHTVPPPLRSVPVLKWDQASSYRGGAVVGAGEWVAVAAEVGPRAFAIRQQGDAMASLEPPSIQDGDIVIIDPDAEYGHGSIVLAKRPSDQHEILRMVWFDGGMPGLKALNPTYPLLDMPPNTVIIGKAVVSQTNLP